MLIDAYKRAFSVLMKKPLRLWGLSLMSALVVGLAMLFSIAFLPLGIAFSYIITVGMSKVYLDALNGKEVNSDQLFEGTKRPFRVAGGMAWRDIWSFIWGFAAGFSGVVVFCVFVLFFNTILEFFKADTAVVVFSVIGVVLGVIVMIAGSVWAVIKTLSYSFVPYILATNPEVNATEALRMSIKMTEGKKLWIFLSNFIPSVVFAMFTTFLDLLSLIPVVGAIFLVLGFVVSLAYSALFPLFQGLYSAALYEAKVEPKAAAPAAPAAPVESAPVESAPASESENADA